VVTRKLALVREGHARREQMCGKLQLSLFQQHDAGRIKENRRGIFGLRRATGVGGAKPAHALFVQGKTARIRQKRKPQGDDTREETYVL